MMSYKVTKRITTIAFVGFVIFLYFLCSPASIFAKDLGVHGRIYQIKEQDFLEFIKERIGNLQQSGKWQALNQKFLDDVKKHIDRPHSVEGIAKAKENTTRFFDPSIIIKRDVFDINGTLLAKAGTKINPLTRISLTKELVFYDADDIAQVKWVQKENNRVKGKDKLILVNGSVRSQAKLFVKPVYFDQLGALSSHFGIISVPTTITQKGLLLEIKEVKLDD